MAIASGQVSYDEEREPSSHGACVVALLALATFISLWGLTAGPGLSDHEAVVGQVARRMRQSGDWLIPYLNDFPEVRKPPLPYWLVALSSWAIDPPQVQPPVSPAAARLPSALASILTTMLVYALGRSMFGSRAGLVCGAVMATCAGGMYFSHNAQVEMVLTFFCAASFACFWWGTHGPARWRRAFMLLFYAALSWAMLAKAPLPLVVVGLPLAVWWFVTVPLARIGAEPRPSGSASVPLARVREDDLDAEGNAHPLAILRRQISWLRELRFLTGALIFLAIFAPWPLYIYFHVDNVTDLWKIEFLDRYTGDLSAKTLPFWYYLPIALVLVFPFSLSLPEAAASPFLRGYRTYRAGLLFVLTWAVVDVAFLSTSAFKRPHYLASALPAVALLLGPTLERLFLTARSFSRRNVVVTCVLAIVLVPAGLALAAPFVTQPYPHAGWTYRLAAIILSAGVLASCVAFLKRRRMVSLMVLQLSVAVGFAGTWDALGQSRALQWQAFAMMDQLKAHSIGADDPITWVVGRPDARLMYYLDQRIEPLFTTLEMAARGRSRDKLSQALLDEGAGRLRQRLVSRTEEYFIVPARYWDTMRHDMDFPAREVFRVVGSRLEEDDDDWVVITNDWNTGEEEDQPPSAHGAGCRTNIAGRRSRAGRVARLGAMPTPAGVGMVWPGAKPTTCGVRLKHTLSP